MIISRAEAQTVIGKANSITNADLGLLNLAMPIADQALKTWAGYSLEQATYTHFLPARSRNATASGIAFYDRVGDKAIAVPNSQTRSKLLLPETPVRSITSIHQERNAYAGQASGSFESDALLVANTDYWLDLDEVGLAKSGIVYRVSTWPNQPRSIKVIYLAGYTAAELGTGIAATIKLAAMMTFSHVFNSLRQEQSSEGVGTVLSERLGDWSATYDKGATEVLVPDRAKRIMIDGQFVNMSRFV